MTNLKDACHSECSEESSTRYRAAKQGEEDPSFLRMTIKANVISPSEATDLNTQDDNKR